jgi:ParB family transcriptional regulator, chromosome partitioning protein
MERRVLIVESQHDFALSMASLLRTAGYQTATAGSAAEAQRELELRRPDLVVLRAELPDQSGFVLCGQIRKGKFSHPMPVLILSSDVGQDGLSQHAQGPNAADAYLSIPFEMGDLAQMAQGLVPLDDMDSSLDAALSGTIHTPTREMAAVPPPLRAPPPGSPPRLPRRERRSALNDEDRAFLDRAFQSIADRKTELLAESRQARRSAPRREQMGTPEGKIQILRDELKAREAQVARISEIWTVRERELLSVEDRLHEKDVELQGLKMQVDDLLRRFNDAQAAMLQKEREHGATVDDLLLQRFATEKDLIEVVASKEKDLNTARRELIAGEDEAQRMAASAAAAAAAHEALERQLSVTTLEAEVREQKLSEELAQKTAQATQLDQELTTTRESLARTEAERNAHDEANTATIASLKEEMERARGLAAATIQELEARALKAEQHGAARDEEVAALTEAKSKAEVEHAHALEGLGQKLDASEHKGEDLRLEVEHLTQQMADRLAERDAKQLAVEKELATAVEQHEAADADFHRQIQTKLERIGELEGELDSARAGAVEREAELAAEYATLVEAKRTAETDLTGRLTEAQTRGTSLEQELTLEKSARGAVEGELHATSDALQAREKELAEARAELEKRAAAAAEFMRQLEEADVHLRALEERAAALEATLGERDSTLASMRGELEATHQALTESQTHLASTEQLVLETQEGLQRTTTALEESRAALEQERAARARAEQQATGHAGRLASLEPELQELHEQHSHLKLELGARMAEVTQLTARAATAEDARMHVEERLADVQEEAGRREELLRGDLTALVQQAEDARSRMADLQTEGRRERDALAHEMQTKGEALRQAEARLRELQEVSEKQRVDLSAKLATASKEAERATGDAEKRRVALSALQAESASERDRLQETLGEQLRVATEQVEDFAARLEAAEAESRAAQSAVSSQLMEAEARTLSDRQTAAARIAELEAALKEATASATTRTRRAQELENALEASASSKVRTERELQAKLAASEAKANEAVSRLTQSVKERKELEGRMAAEVNELVARQRAELERRDAAKAQEVARLQAAVQERSRALKVAELELARVKGRPAGVPATRSQEMPQAQEPAVPRTSSPGISRPPPTQLPRIPETSQSGRRPDPEDWNALVDELDKPGR